MDGKRETQINTNRNTMKQRILYIDNLKALSIFSVIIGHVYWFTWNHSENVWTQLISTFYMPLFFFISGAFAKDTMLLGHLGKKAKQLLLPFLTVGGLYTLLDSKWHELFFGMAHHGYWFLPTLFVLFTFFYCRCILSRLLKIKDAKSKVFCDIVYVLALFLGLKVLLHFLEQDTASLLCLNRAHSYLLPFFFGYIVFSNKPFIKELLERFSTLVYAVALPLYVGVFYLVFCAGIKVPAHSLLLSLLAIFILFVLFRSLTIRNDIIQNIVSYIGQHTLEIYVIQYFFLPHSFTPSESIVGGGKFIDYLHR